MAHLPEAGPPDPAQHDPRLRGRAQVLSPSPLVFDGHNDVLLALRSAPGGAASFFESHDEGHLDLPRAVTGGFGGGFFATWVPADVEDPYEGSMPPTRPLCPPVEAKRAQRVAGHMFDLLLEVEARSDGRFRVVHSADVIEACLGSGVLAAVMHLEGAEPIKADLGELEPLYRKGLRSLGIVWSRANVFGEGVPFRFGSTPDTGPGLTEPGRALVRACNQLGIMIDLAHLNWLGFWDVAALSDAPLVASHSNAHAICPMSRNLTDVQLGAIRDSGGLVGVNFAVQFLREDGEDDAATPVELVVRHVDHLVEQMGIDHVALGSDFDGAHVSAEIGDAAGLPKVLDALRAAGYDEAALRKIAHENWVRVLRQTWK